MSKLNSLEVTEEQRLTPDLSIQEDQNIELRNDVEEEKKERPVLDFSRLRDNFEPEEKHKHAEPNYDNLDITHGKDKLTETQKE